MTELQKVFEFKGKEVRTVLINNNVWFVAKDVCEVLELSNSRKALTRLEEEEKADVTLSDGRQNRKYSIVNESGLYELIFSSKKKEAKDFKKWVKTDVLPSIRKHGLYMTDNLLERTLEDPDFLINLLIDYKEEKAKRKEAEKTVNILTHVNKNYTATEIAKEIGFRSAAALNRDLEKRKIQFKQNNTWILYSQYADKGYVDIKQDVLDNGKVIYHRKFTQLGREFLLRLYEVNEKKPS